MTRPLRHCLQLGLCQSRQPRCADCPSQQAMAQHRYPFAPGIVEHTMQLRPMWWVRRILAWMLVAGIASAAVGLLAGWYVGVSLV